MAEEKIPGFNPTKEKIHEIIFEADTPAGKIFDVTLLIFILGSIVAVMLESIEEIGTKYASALHVVEWIFTIFFTIEYILRIYCVYRPWKYILSFYGIIDFLAIIPTYLSLILPGSQYLLVIRALRLMRIFRIFKLARFLREGSVIIESLKASRAKITVFLVFILLNVVIIGSIMYLIEADQDSGFTSIPRSVYWAIVTLTTVGYGDIAPATELGQFLAAIVMIMGYSVIAVPTGIVSAEFMGSGSSGKRYKKEHEVTTRSCRHCAEDGHDFDAEYCKYCGENLGKNINPLD